MKSLLRTKRSATPQFSAFTLIELLGHASALWDKQCTLATHHYDQPTSNHDLQLASAIPVKQTQQTQPKSNP